MTALLNVLSFLHHGQNVWQRLFFSCWWISEVSSCVFLVTQTYFVFCLKLNGIGVVADYCSVNNVYVLMSHYALEQQNFKKGLCSKYVIFFVLVDLIFFFFAGELLHVCLNQIDAVCYKQPQLWYPFLDCVKTSLIICF